MIGNQIQILLHIINLKICLIVLGIEIHFQIHELHLILWTESNVHILQNEIINHIFQPIFHLYHNEILQEHSTFGCLIQCEMLQIVKILLFGVELEVQTEWFHFDNIPEVFDHEFHNIDNYEAQTLDVFTINGWIIVLFTLEVNLLYTRTHNNFSHGIIQSIHLEQILESDDEQHGELITFTTVINPDSLFQKDNEAKHKLQIISIRLNENSDIKRKTPYWNGVSFLYISSFWESSTTNICIKYFVYNI